MNTPSPAPNTYRYGPSALKINLAVAFFAACAVAGWFMSREGDPKGALVTLGSLVLVAAGVAARVYDIKVPRQIVFTAHSVQIPQGQFSAKVFELPYADLVHVERATVSGEDVLLIAHRNGNFKLPVAMLGYIDVEQLQQALMAHRAVPASPDAPTPARHSASQI